MYADISALYYRPWQFYHALVLAMEHGVLHQPLSGSDDPVTTPRSTMAALAKVNSVAEGTGMPWISVERIEEISHRDILGLLGILGSFRLHRISRHVIICA